MRAAPFLTAVCAISLGCAPEAPGTSGADGSGVVEPTSGRLVIVGGALSRENAEVYQAIMDGRQGDGPLCVIPAASGEPEASMNSARETLARYAGGGAVEGIMLSTADASQALDPAVAARLEACSGYYFTGGAQSRVLDVFLPQGDTTPAFRAVWSRWRDGAVLAGSSAGAAMMSGVMIASGASPGAVEHGMAAEEDGEGVSLRSGMGFFPQAMLDQHFLARGRIGRLLVTVLATDSLPLGLGIDENTALVVDGNSARVVGASGVVVVDGRAARREGATRGTGLVVTLAGAGDVLDLTTFQVRRGAGKVAFPMRDGSLASPEDPFARWAFLHLMVGLAETADSEASFPVGGAALTVREGENFSAAVQGAEGGVQGTPAGFSAGPFLVDLVAAGS